MGTKFGNVHVITDDLNSVLSALASISQERAVSSPIVLNHGYEFIMERANQMRNIYYLAEWKPGWVCILNDCFGWGESEEFGEKLSSHINYPVITVSYFDDDLFELNIFLNGSNVTGHLWCSSETKEVYDLEDKVGDIGIISSILGHEYFNNINDVLQLKDCEQAVERLEELIQVPLWVHSDWFNDIEDEEFVSKYTMYDFNK